MAPMRKPSKNAFLHPAIHAPAAMARTRVRLGRAHRAGVQPIFESLKQPEVFFACSARAGDRTAPQFAPATCLPSSSASDSSTRANFFFVLRLRSAQRQTPHRFEQSHRGHGRFHGNRVGLDEIHFHQRQIFPLQQARGCEIALRGRAARGESSPRESRSTPRKSRRARPARSSATPERRRRRARRTPPAPAPRIVAICAMSPDASLTPTMFSISASRFSVAGSMLTPVRRGML